MTFATGATYELADYGRRSAGPRPSQGLLGVILLAGAVSSGAWVLAARPFTDLDARTGAVPVPAKHSNPVKDAPQPAIVPAGVEFSVRVDSATLSPLYTATLMATSIARNTRFDPQVAAIQPDNAPAMQVGASESIGPQPAAAAIALPADPDVPLPAPRPSDLDLKVVPTPPSHPTLSRNLRGQRDVAALPAAPADGRNLFEKLFGIGSQSSGPVLAYASPETAAVPRSNSQPIVPGPGLAYGGQTAIYDISAHTVYLPDGSTLEAHSGLGNRLDDPNSVRERDRGATPPHVYDLEPRAQLFHGVRALRLNPVGGGGVFGRAGLLAHSFMLGPNGQSNGCVSFRNYDAFLHAYESGSVRRLVVVARRS